jgi:hypothetical protein
MIKKSKKILFLAFILLFFVLFAVCFGFNWPQLVESINSFSSFFGQPRGSAFTNSLIFENPSEILPAKDGEVIINLKSGIADMGWFESTLGNAVVLSHENELLTVYGNLEDIYIEESATTLQESDVIGVSGSSGWQTGKNSLEFQVIDTKSNKVINPFVLMPTIQSINTLAIKDVVAVNNSGKSFPISNYVKINSGVYKLYIKKQSDSMTYKTSVYANGAMVENIMYDVLTKRDSRLSVQGKDLYQFEEIYPNQEMQLLAEIILPKGRNLITITIEDFFGNTKTANYTVEVI